MIRLSWTVAAALWCLPAAAMFAPALSGPVGSASAHGSSRAGATAAISGTGAMAAMLGADTKVATTGGDSVGRVGTAPTTGNSTTGNSTTTATPAPTSGDSTATAPQASPLPAAPPAAVKDELPRVAVNDLVAQGASPQQAAAMTDAVIASLSNRKLFQVITSRDLQTLLGAERQKQLLGVCADNPAACTADISAASVARFVLSGQLARVGSAFQLSLQMVDTEKGQTIGRSTRLAGDLETLRSLVPYAAAEATGSPLPPPPSKVLSVSMIALGGGTFFAGGVLGLLGLSRQQQLNDELCPTAAGPTERCTGTNLHPRDFYIQKDNELSSQKALALGLMVGGAVLGTVGIVLLPPAERAGLTAMLVPSPTGFAIAGAFP